VPKCCIVLPVLGREVAIQPGDRRFVALRLNVAVGVGSLADAGVTHLLLDPSKVRSIARSHVAYV
jgi:hypothetical protein